MPEQPESQNPCGKLVLVDAYSLLFRAYFSSRYLSTSDDRPTGALFGLGLHLLKSLLHS